MNMILRAGLVTAALATTLTFAAPAQAGGLLNRDRGSVKDYGYAPPRPAAGPCYVRGDVGYAFYTSPDVKWPVNTIDRTFDGTGALIAETFTYVGDDVNNADFDDTWFGEVGIGCGSGSRGFRADVTLGFRGTQDFKGIPQEFVVTENGVPEDVEDPMHTDLRSTTLMANFYYDFGKFGRFVPYVGFGLGVAYHELDEVYFTENPFLTNRIRGNNDLSFAWSVMAGAAYQLTSNAVLDVGYRYMDLGEIESDRVDSAGFVNPAVKFDDIQSHEIKIGLRYHFGRRGHAPVPMK